MKKKNLYDYAAGSKREDIHIKYREGYFSSAADYHKHDFYEINLILSGNVKILLSDRLEEGIENCIVLTPPGTPHYIACVPDALYSRLYLRFASEYIENWLPEWNNLSFLFGEKGTVIMITQEQAEYFKSVIEQIQQEESSFRKRLLIYYLLSHLSDLSGETNHGISQIPPYILEAIAYLENHYSEKVLAEALGKKLHIGRTTLMTEFKKHTGSTIGEYLTNCRLRNAIRLLEKGETLEYTAYQCGFADSSGLIRSFKRCYGATPREYVKNMK